MIEHHESFSGQHKFLVLFSENDYKKTSRMLDS